ncbi:MAG: ABC transporter permease [Clostridiales bacterium]|nr:ABC transporter permease [Clostridiales bacterium]
MAGRHRPMGSMDKDAKNEYMPDDFEPAHGERFAAGAPLRGRASYLGDVRRAFGKNKVAVASLILMGAMIFFVLFGPMMVRFDYYSNDYDVINQPPDGVHWFGTDTLGRDLWARVWVGGRVSLLIAILGTVFPEVIGLIVGGVSGYVGGRADMAIMRAIDVLMGIPSLIYMILLMLVLGSGNIATMVIAISITGWMGSARATRGLVLQLKNQDFVTAGEALGGSPAWIIFRHLIPNTMGIRVVGITMSIPGVIFYEAFLSYIGLGVAPPNPSWGQLIKAAAEQFRYYPYQFAVPCLFIGLAMLCFNLIGDGLRDALDPKLRD